MRYQISVYVPVDYAEKVKEAMFQQGAGKIGHYERCSWQVLGEGQFLPTEHSKPFFGIPGTIEKVAEYRIEMVCEAEYLSAVLAALKQAHPYEAPAYQVGTLEAFE